jgi:hypothetical protein
MLDEPRAWLAAQKAKHVAIYAHGGLNSRTARSIAPGCWDRTSRPTAVYPIFLVWRTGFLESLAGIVGDEIRGVPSPGASGAICGSPSRTSRGRHVIAPSRCAVPGDARARGVEPDEAERVRGRAEPSPPWDSPRRYLRALIPKDSDLRLHLIGHSAGSIILGHLLDQLGAQSLTAQTCSLFAPACTVRFALEHYRPAIEAGVLGRQALSLDILSDGRELGDAVGPYGKSLLYLVSRALEDHHKTPILGLASSGPARRATLAPPTPSVAPTLPARSDKWLTFWGPGPRPRELSAPSVSDGRVSIPASHGCFDNDRDTITRTLGRILGRGPRSR